jgi:branched-chain amino acid transport system substrate-binding protein
VIKIGEINSYKAQPAFLEPYKKGMELAVEEINASGGLLGKKVRLVIRDDNANPGDAVRAAEELVSREKVDVLTGSFLSHIGLALTDFARQKKFFFLASEPLTDKIVWQNGNRYTYRLRPSTYMQVSMVVPEAVALKKKRWALVYPNYEYGQSAAANFKRLLPAAIPGAEIVAEQFPALGRIDAGATVGALGQARPDGIFNVLFGADLTAFVREGNTRGLFERRTVVSLLTGEPEYLIPLGEETPEGWIVTGYPWDQVTGMPGHQAFVDGYRARFNDTPRKGSLLGYVTVQVIASLLNKANSLDNEALVDALADLRTDTVVGPVAMRGLDHQGTMGTWVGETTLRGRQGAMRNARYADGANYMFSEAEVRAARPG